MGTILPRLDLSFGPISLVDHERTDEWMAKLEKEREGDWQEF